jgi:hypothetical protein
MNRLFALIAAGALMCAGTAYGQATTKAADPKAAEAKAPNPQQEKMTACNQKAGDKKGEERKAFMKTCLSAQPSPPMTQSEKMTMCNKKIAGLKGEERNKAQSECMKGAS